MDKKYIELLDSILAAAKLALAITINSRQDSKRKEIADCYLEEVMKDIWKARLALSKVLKMQNNEVHDNYRYPRVSADLSK